MTLEEMWDAGTEWATDNVIEPVTDWVEDKVIDYAINQKIDEFKKIPSDIAAGFVSHDKLTPELIKQGWKLGLDNVPYNSNLKYTADDWARDQANAAADARVQAAATGGAVGDAGTTGSDTFQLSQDLRQRTPSGTIYNPDISEYLNSGLFNYTGPGGVPEYTYGQGLRTDGAGYDIWGTPTDVPNPYYWGQFGEGYTEPTEPTEPTGPADGAISLPPVDLPAGVPPTNNNPNVGTPTTNINTGGGTGPDGKDLTYQETLDYFGLDPVSTMFSGPNDKLIEEAIMNQDVVKETLPSGILDWVGGVNETGIDGTQQYFPSGMSFPADETGIGSAYQDRNLSNQKNFEIANSMVGGLLENNIIRNPNQETQPYRGIFVDPRTVPEINEVQSNTIYPPTMPAGYDEDGGISLVTTTDKPYIPSIPIVQGDNEDFDKPIIQNDVVENTNYNKIELPKVSSDLDSQYNTIWLDMPEYDENFNYNTGKMAEGPAGSPYYGTPPSPVEETVPYSNERTHYEMEDLWGDRYNWGIMDYIDHYNPFKDDSVAPLEGPAGSTAPSYTGSIEAEPSIWDRTMATIAGVAGNNYTGDVGFPGGHANVIANSAQVPAYSSGMTIPPSLQEGGDAEGAEEYALMEKTARELAAINKVNYDSAVTSDMVNSSFPLNNSLSNSLIKQEIEKIEKRDLSHQVSQNLSNIFQPEPPTFVNYGPPNMQFLGGRYGL